MKPTILVYLGNDFSREYFAPLNHYYTFIYHKLDYAQDPLSFLHHSLSIIKKKKISIDAVLGDIDDASAIASLAAKKLKLSGPSPQSIFKAQHKILFVRECEQLLPYFPKSLYVDLTKKKYMMPKDYPAFIKPTRGALSIYSYMLSSQKEFESTIEHLKTLKRKDLYWFDELLKASLKKKYPSTNAYIVQPFMTARQYTVDGFVSDGKIQLFGFTQTIYTPDRKSFIRFDHPGTIEQKIKQQVLRFLQKYIKNTNYDHAGFNMEFFVSKGKIYPIEFNTRLSKQFSPLFGEWYLKPSVGYVVDVALGKNPQLIEKSKAERNAASSCVLRTTKDCKIQSVPTQKELKKLHALPGVLGIRILVEPGKKLSDYKQDSYTYRYALIDIAGKNKTEILQTLEIVKKKLRIQLVPILKKGSKGDKRDRGAKGV